MGRIVLDDTNIFTYLRQSFSWEAMSEFMIDFEILLCEHQHISVVKLNLLITQV